jgi:hypothetical protein
VKKYTSIVKHKEIEKFYRDLDANTNSLKGGIFISLTSKIAGRSKKIEIEKYKHFKIVFVYSSDPHVIEMAVEIMNAMLDSNQILKTEICDKANRKLLKLQDQLDQLALSRTYINETREVMQRQFNKIYETTLQAELGMKHTLQSILNLFDDPDLRSDFRSDFRSDLRSDLRSDFQSDVIHPVILNNLSEYITTDQKYIGSAYFKNVEHQQLVCQILCKFCNFETNQEILVDKCSKEIILKIIESEKEKYVGKIKFFTSKTELFINSNYFSTENGSVSIPKSCKFDGRHVCVAIDKEFLRNANNFI